MAAALAGCAGNSARPFIYGYSAGDAALADTTTHTIHLATSRARAEDPRTMFTGERAPRNAFARLDVSVPPGHEPGRVERPRRGAPDPQRHFVAYDPEHFGSRAAFVASIDAALAARPPDERNVFLYVHGFNNDFDGAVLRLAQLIEDADYPGIAVLYTWASRGNSLDYLYDRDSATAARDLLEDMLETLALTDARSVELVAHSMGTWLTMETLRQMRIAGKDPLGDRLSAVVLASPDINIDVFKSQMRRYGRPDRPFILLVSRDDRALALSRRLSGNTRRVGNYGDDAELADLGLVVVDLSDVDAAGDRSRHTKFASNPALVRLLGSRLQANQSLLQQEIDDAEDLDAEAFGRALGDAIGDVAGLVITTPLVIIQAPLEAASDAAEIVSRPQAPTR